jgi:hypothetical protein
VIVPIRRSEPTRGIHSTSHASSRVRRSDGWVAFWLSYDPRTLTILPLEQR